MAASFDRRASEPAAPVASPRAAPPAKASHDVAAPPALIAFMLKSWKPRPRRLPAKVAHAAAHHARRRALSAMFPGEVLVIPTGHEKVRANDTHYRFRPGTDFFYLTGNHEPDCVLVMLPKRGGHEDVLLVEPNPGRADKTFFTDRNKGELWVGPRLGVPESRARFGVDRCAAIDELTAILARAKRGGVRALRGLSEKIDDAVPTTKAGKKADQAFAAALSELRLKKDRAELGELSAAIASTHRGFEDVIARMRGARSEREIEGVFALRARVEGNDVGYGTIAASGHHACTLHWTRNDGAIKRGDLLLLDAGVEGNSLYTADITRTLPISGRFTGPQRAVYELVAAAQDAAFREVRPGRDFLAPNRAAMRVLTEGLIELGVLRCSAEEALDDAHQYYKRYTLHNVSHMLGLDVHDCAKARQEAYKFGKLEPGMVLTVEPGLYFQTDDLTVPAALRGIGVRIEDDVVVTKTGMRNLSAAIPRDAADVEAWIARVWRKPRA
ncbi:MAG: aminopeptidase P family protein [Polyangiaceae bacterium]|nr:aminopeptidase P family protein [Polyangiaceae bacterium]